MKDILKINLHSMVDVITNSSTELFICSTDKTKEQVEELLAAMLDVYNKGNDKNLQFDHVFGEITTMETPKQLARVQADKEWIEDSYGAMDLGVGTILIESADDNSIPYVLWDLIEDLFNARRKHLG